MPMNLNLNSYPYYDDFDVEKGFHRILFRPGYAVQARELTQVQTILQNQIKLFGNNIFTDGTVIFGCPESTNFSTPYVTVYDEYSSPAGAVIDNDTIGNSINDPDAPGFKGATLSGNNHNVKAIVKEAVGGTDAGSDHKTLYLQYTATGEDNVTTTFEADEVITVYETGAQLTVMGSGTGSLFSVGDGIVYAKGNFVIHSAQTIVVSRYTTTPTQKVGFIIAESIITSNEDQTLLDPAQGSYNFTAPGADRYHLETVLTAYGSTDTVPEEFYILFDIAEGNIKRKYNVTQYGELNKTLARRTYDESGDYTVRAFPLLIQEHFNSGINNGRYTAGEGGDSSQLALNVQPGKAYVKGFEHELFSTEYLDVDKGIEVDTIGNDVISTNYGYYVTTSALTGTWPFYAGTTVALSGGALSATAKVREVEYAGSAGVYNMYLYDVTISSGTMLALTTITSGSHQATVTAVIGGAGSPEAIFPASRTNLKTFADASYVYRKIFTSVTVGTPAPAGQATITVSGAETFAFSNTTLANDIFIENDSSHAALPFTSASVAVPGTTCTIDGIGGSFSGTANISALVRKTISQNPKKLHKDQYVVLEDPGAGPSYCLGYYDVKEIQEVWTATTGAGYPADHDALLIDANWTQTTDFTLDDGQRDGLYEIAEVTPGSSWASKDVIILLTYYEHGTASPYYTVDSYPLPVENVAPAADEIEWYEIPVYTSSTGKAFNLRDCVDFRPTIEMPGTLPSTSIADASAFAKVNPAAPTTFLTGFAHPAPQEEFIADISYHLPRIDRIVVDTEGNFTTVTGVSSLNPVYPRQPDNAMTLGYVRIAPYPSLSPFMAKLLGMPQYACSVTQIDNRRYTMRDIGNIQRRVDRLEYYTSLSMLEQNTANMMIQNGAGLDRYKNGILVDDFVGHNVANVLDPAHHCSIGNSELHPFFTADNIDLEFNTGTVWQSADDAIIVVRQLLIDSAIGDSVETASATGVVVHAVLLGQNSTYRWVRLYLNTVTGTFAESDDLTVGTGTLAAVPVGIIQGDTIPDVVVVPSAGSLATLPYEHQVYAENPYASKTRNVVSQILFTYNGIMQLTPPADVWTDTSTLPEVQINEGGAADNWTSMDNAWGTQWGVWEDVWQGVDSMSRVISEQNISTTEKEVVSEVTETTIQRQQRQGTGISVTNSTSTTNLGNRVVSTALIPYMRSVLVSFSATGLKPYTTIYPFFDGVNVSDNCRMTGDAYGDPLIVELDGTIAGEFLIPGGRFAVGTKTFALCDNATNPASTSIKTIATASFNSSGLSVVEQGTIVSTQVPQITISQQTETQNLVVTRLTSQNTEIMQRKVDPIAQTFFISNNPNGVLLTKADLYFQSKSSTAGITFQIREVINGYPAAAIVPYSIVTLDPKDVNISEDASLVTEFKFESPVYLRNDTEYCFVLLPVGSDENYNLWVAELGATVVGTTERIDKQPYSGVLFVSANNNTWSAIQSEDTKFTLYQAIFDPNVTAEISVVNVPLDYVSVDVTAGSFSVGDAVTFKNVSTAIVATGTIKYYDVQRDVAHVSILTGNTLTAVTMENATSGVADVSYLVIGVDALSPTLGHMDFNNTDVVWTYQIQGVPVSPASLSTTGTTHLLTSTGIRSQSDSGTGDLDIMATLSTEVENISPILDLSRMGCVVISNYISTAVTNEYTPAAGTARSKYITRRVILDDDYDADDLRVYVTADIPGLASIAVHAKLLHATDTTAFDDRPWTELETTSLSSPGAKEYTYTIPLHTGTGRTDKNSVYGARDPNDLIYYYSTDGGTTKYEGFKVFAVKILLLSEESAQPPVVYDMRAIALMT